jgi:hypothetical protein
MEEVKTKKQYQKALKKIEELLVKVGDSHSYENPDFVMMDRLSELVAQYKPILGQSKTKQVAIPHEKVIEKIYLIREKKVMLDRDLAALYYVPTKRLKEQVRRNIYRFPKDFIFELSKEELKDCFII